MTNMKLHPVWLFLLVALLALPASALAGRGETMKKAAANEEAQQFQCSAKTLVGQAKVQVIELLGIPDRKTADEGYECWIYKRHFGTFRRKKAVFGHRTLTLEVRAEILLKEGIVVSTKVSAIDEVAKPRRE
ncbi:MAG TPA: hypothetical protein VK163_03055 [Opitutaceae bacterium]|nr:hypothetical protein [Opitutaceae bacterium]